ncbi:MAG TPA: DUF58 domain-containing protein [Vicinamibacterales bacterium]
MRVSRPGELRFLDPAVIARLATLELRARTIVEGFLSGLHRSPLRGFSVEFAEYRQYFPGDELSTIDWKVYARTDRYVVKKFEEETNLKAYLLLDVSGSMGYGSGSLTKLEYGAVLAASLAYLMQRQRDAAGLFTFDSEIRTAVAPSLRPGHLSALLHALDAQQPGARTDVGPPFTRLADALAKRGLVVVISDLFDDPARVIKGMKYFRHRGCDVIVFHLLDTAELTFPFDQPARFRDMEDDSEILMHPARARDSYLEGITGLIDGYRRELGAAGVDYQLLDTGRPLDSALLAYLTTRARRQ